MSNYSRTLKADELPYLQLAKKMANSLEYKPWVHWMRANFKYSQAVRMCTFIGITMPSHGFYQKLKSFDLEAT